MLPFIAAQLGVRHRKEDTNGVKEEDREGDRKGLLERKGEQTYESYERDKEAESGDGFEGNGMTTGPVVLDGGIAFALD